MTQYTIVAQAERPWSDAFALHAAEEIRTRRKTLTFDDSVTGQQILYGFAAHFAVHHEEYRVTGLRLNDAMLTPEQFCQEWDSGDRGQPNLPPISEADRPLTLRHRVWGTWLARATEAMETLGVAMNSVDFATLNSAMTPPPSSATTPPRAPTAPPARPWVLHSYRVMELP